MKQQTIISLTLIAAALLVSAAFQNCSNVKFATQKSQSKSDDDGVIQIDYPASDSDSEQTTSTDPTPAPELPNDSVVESAYTTCDSLPISAPDFTTASSEDVLLQAIEGNRSVESANSVRVVNFRGALEIKKAKAAELINVRGSTVVAAQDVSVVDFQSVTAGDRLLIDAGNMKSIQNTRTPLCIRAASFASLVDLRTEEPLILIGRTVNGVKPRIDKLQNIRGVVIVRGIDIDDVVDFKGAKIVLENSVVGRMTNVRTDLYLKNSLIGNEVDVQGQRVNY